MKKLDRNDLLFQISKREFIAAAKISPEDEPRFYALLKQRLHLDTQLKNILSVKNLSLPALSKQKPYETI
jgi:hypothetical protein